MILQEFIYIKDKKLKKALDKLNKKRAKSRKHQDHCDDGIQPDCKCPYEDVDPKNCEDLCRLNHK